MAGIQQRGPTAHRHFDENDQVLIEARRQFWADNYGDYESSLDNELHSVKEGLGRYHSYP